MTREEAIQALAGLLSEYCSDCPMIYEEKCDCESQEAIDMAIDALQWQDRILTQIEDIVLKEHGERSEE